MSLIPPDGSTPCAARLLDALTGLPAHERAATLARLSDDEVETLLFDWSWQARPDQMPPAGEDWTVWLMLGGRGAGKTRAGAEWVRGLVQGLAPFAEAPVGRIALVGETLGDARAVMVEGVSGLMNVHPCWERPEFQPSRRRLVWASGAVAELYSAEDPEALRGPQFEAAWCDEIGKWRQADAVWDMLMFGLRLGGRPRVCATTTPRATPLVKRLATDRTVRVARARTADNAHNLATSFLTNVVGRYHGTRLGRQELDGELIADRDDALFSREAIEAGRLAAAPDLARIVVAVDPPASSGRRSDACGIVAAGLGADGRVYVLADASRKAATPTAWARAAVALYHRLEADALVAEVNQGGEMVAAVIGGVDPGLPVRTVRASRGKWLRAEPVAALYEQGRVAHVGALAMLEDEMCDFGLDGLSGGRSPDRLDALVWAVTWLTGGGEPRVRRV